MKRIFKAAISLILVFALVLSVAGISFAVPSGKSDIPIVYLMGQGHALVKEKGNPDSEVIYPLNFDMQYIKDTIEKLNPVFAEAVVTGDYTEYCNVICNAVEPIYADIQLDGNGELKDGSGVPWSWSRETLTDTKQNGVYGLFDYNFIYDWRIDPSDVADELKSYIDDVMAVTGAQKVNVVSRCMGCNIVVAYLQEYGGGQIDRCVIYCGVIEGADSCSKPFSGQISLDSDGVERFAYDYFANDELLYSFIKSSVSLLNKTYGLDFALSMVAEVYEKVKDDIVPRLLLMTYGTFPSYWSMVSAADFDTAKQLIFGENTEEYKGLIRKIDVYHQNVKLNARGILATERAAGVAMFLICKYGYQMVPVTPGATDIADSVVELSMSSLGATTCKLDKTFSRRYLRNAESAGTDKYISPDKQVDASTCLFPDNTWIIKGITHSNFPDCIDELIMTFIHHDGYMTIDDYEQYPQYLVFEEESSTIHPMREDNSDTAKWNKDGILVVLTRFIAQLIAVVREYVVPLIEKYLGAPAKAEVL